MKLLFGITLALAASCHGAPPICGGDEAKEKQFPHHVGLILKGRFSCGGSLVSSSWLVTAAHCAGHALTDYEILAGTNSLTEGGVKRKLITIIKHEKYGDFKNDIAVMELDEPLELSDSIRPIVPFKDSVPAWSPITICGWGRISTSGPISDKIKFNTQINIMDDVSCGYAISTDRVETVVCLAHSTGNGACFGDSGSSAMYEGKLIGVASFVEGGCGSSLPDGYAKVSHFVKWIEEKTGLSFD